MITLGSEVGPIGQVMTSLLRVSEGYVGTGSHYYLGVRDWSHGTGPDLVVE
jgi:hypothetical protein